MKGILMPLTNGRIRELIESDLSILIGMSKEPDIKRYYFFNKNTHFEDYLNECLKQKEKESNRIDYALPIEVEGIIRGLLMFYSKFRIPLPPKISKISLFEIGFFIGRDYRRQGIAESVVRIAVPFAFEQLAATSVHAVCSEENIASKNLLRKLKFQERAYFDDKKTLKPLLVYVAQYPFLQ